jgi:hypothetical protein
VLEDNAMCPSCDKFVCKNNPLGVYTITEVECGVSTSYNMMEIVCKKCFDERIYEVGTTHKTLVNHKVPQDDLDYVRELWSTHTLSSRTDHEWETVPLKY